MSNIDLNKYKDFVEAVTSKASNDLTTFMNRCDELDANYTGDGVHGPDINVPLLLTACLGLAAEGGDLELWYGGGVIQIPKNKGLTVIFPSFSMHRVTPITKGTRKSLVLWLGGEHYK